MKDVFTGETYMTTKVREIIDGLDYYRSDIEKTLELSHNTHTFDDVTFRVLTGSMRFWELENSYMITEVLVYPQKKVYHVFMAGGNLEEIMAMNDRLAEAAIEAGCDYISLCGRRGWAKVLKSIGWKEEYSICTRSVK